MEFTVLASVPLRQTRGEHFTVLMMSSGWELTERALGRFTGWPRPLTLWSLSLWSRLAEEREPFKDADCGGQTLDALCRAPPAGPGTASTLLAPMLLCSVEAMCERKQAVGESDMEVKKKMLLFLLPHVTPSNFPLMCGSSVVFRCQGEWKGAQHILKKEKKTMQIDTEQNS